MIKQLLPLFLDTFLLLICAGSAFSQTRQPPRIFAAPNDTVWVIVNSVKADKRAQFERFLHEIFWPGASKLSKEEQRVFRQTRILHPVKAEADGTYAYFFIMDPLIPNRDYSILNLLTKMYGEPKAKEHFKLFTEALAGRHKEYKVVQSRH